MARKSSSIPISTLFLSIVIIVLVLILIFNFFNNKKSKMNPQTNNYNSLQKDHTHKSFQKNHIHNSFQKNHIHNSFQKNHIHNSQFSNNYDYLCSVCKLNNFGHCQGIDGCDCRTALFHSWIRNRKDINYHYHYPTSRKNNIKLARVNNDGKHES